MKSFKLFFILFLCLTSLNCAKYKELQPVDYIAIPDALSNSLRNESSGENPVFGAGFIYLKEYTSKNAMQVARIYLDEYRDRIYTDIILFVYNQELSTEDLQKEEVRKSKATEKTIFIFPHKNMIYSSDFDIRYNTNLKDKLE